MRDCPNCEGSGLLLGDYCLTCGGNGKDPESCEQCDENGVGFNDDGEFLCEDCLFEWAIDQ